MLHQTLYFFILLEWHDSQQSLFYYLSGPGIIHFEAILFSQFSKYNVNVKVEVFWEGHKKFWCYLVKSVRLISCMYWHLVFSDEKGEHIQNSRWSLSNFMSCLPNELANFLQAWHLLTHMWPEGVSFHPHVVSLALSMHSAQDYRNFRMNKFHMRHSFQIKKIQMWK